MLAKVLANRIADQRAAGREQIAADLLKTGGVLFPQSPVSLGRARPACSQTRAWMPIRRRLPASSGTGRA
jgi:hypothetical protein